MTTERILLIINAITCFFIWLPIITSAVRKRNKHEDAIEKLLYPEISQEKRYQDEVQKKMHQIKMGETPSLIGIQLTKEQFEELAPHVKDKSYLENTLRSRVPLTEYANSFDTHGHKPTPPSLIEW